jgi:glycosyltransferase involved in cell wall biosynthesis
MFNPLVSVLIPTYNRAHLLPGTVRTALDQSYSALEVLIIDDGSTDRTAEVVAELARADGRVRYIRQQNRGVSAARNTGIRAARGDFLAFLDSDDHWKDWKLEIQMACMRRLPHVGMVWTDMEAVDPHGRVLNPRYNREHYAAYQWFTYDQLFTERYRLDEVAPGCRDLVGDSCVYAGDIYSAMVMGNLVLTSTVLVRRERFERVQGFDEEFRSGEDHDYHLRTCREGPVAFIDLPAIRYQRGLGDHLTGLRYTIAHNFYRTITRALDRDGDRINLPRHMLNWVLAYANSWVGEELMKMREHRRARPFLLRSFGYRWWQPRVLAQLGLSFFPPAAAERVRSVYRRVKRLGRPQPRRASAAVTS